MEAQIDVVAKGGAHGLWPASPCRSSLPVVTMQSLCFTTEVRLWYLLALEACFGAEVKRRSPDLIHRAYACVDPNSMRRRHWVEFDPCNNVTWHFSAP